MSANIATKSIVTNGLIFYIDAANYKSYITGSSNWRDLTSYNVTGSLVNGPTLDQYSLSFDGVNEYGVFENAGKFNITETTWGAWVYTTKNDNETIISAEGSHTSVTYGYGFRNRTGPNIYWTLGYPGFGYACQTSYGSTNTWFYVTGTASPTTMKIYLNGVYKAQTTVSSIPNSTSPLYIAYYLYPFGPNNYFAGKISNVHIYNRVLTDTEILQNYNAIKGRFGLS